MIVFLHQITANLHPFKAVVFKFSYFSFFFFKKNDMKMTRILMHIVWKLLIEHELIIIFREGKSKLLSTTNCQDPESLCHGLNHSIEFSFKRFNFYHCLKSNTLVCHHNWSKLKQSIVLFLGHNSGEQKISSCQLWQTKRSSLFGPSTPRSLI